MLLASPQEVRCPIGHPELHWPPRGISTRPRSVRNRRDSVQSASPRIAPLSSPLFPPSPTSLNDSFTERRKPPSMPPWRRSSLRADHHQSTARQRPRSSEPPADDQEGSTLTVTRTKKAAQAAPLVQGDPAQRRLHSPKLRCDAVDQRFRKVRIRRQRHHAQGPQHRLQRRRCLSLLDRRDQGRRSS